MICSFRLDREPGLSDATRPDQRDQPPPTQSSGQYVEQVAATDERGQRRAKAGAARQATARGRGARSFVLAQDRRLEGSQLG